MEYVRNCPKCGKIITYKRKADYNRGFLKNTNCKGKNCFKNSSQFKIGKTGQKSPVTWWKEKLSKEEFNIKLQEFKEKQSFNNKGEKNSMYGKPSPKGAGNGWSGWYKNWYFRSLLELSYMIKIIERFKISWQVGEKKELTCKYKFYNKQRTYRADFLLSNKYLIDCKPKKLWKSEENIAKNLAMKEFCSKVGLKFKFVYIPKLSIEEVKHLYDTKQIKFLEKYETKFKQYIESH